tara:strand:- start:11188 stop:12027 length:840 start_codon:yes stop_codon:yes gene_type:complete
VKDCNLLIPKATLGCPCLEKDLKQSIAYNKPPVGETDFGLRSCYSRTYETCITCGHYFSKHTYDLDKIYAEKYSQSTYGGERKEIFKKIMSLPKSKSDNYMRCEAIEKFCTSYWGNSERRKLLDIGSGLGVFPGRMVEKGWDCTALDPDPSATKMIQELVDCKVVTQDFLRAENEELSTEKFDLITFNKVLEHVSEPKNMLTRASKLLMPGGIIYFEVPDGEAAIVEGPEREEFYIEHLHVFTTISSGLLAKAAGLKTVNINSIKENSGKYTIRIFCSA